MITQNPFCTSFPSSSEPVVYGCPPEAPTCVRSVNISEEDRTVEIEWDAAFSNGGDIIGYDILIRGRYGNFFSLASCDGSSAEVINGRSCIVNTDDLQGSPWGL